MKKLIAILTGLILLAGISFASSYLYVEQTKQINGSYVYSMPRLEWNVSRWAGKFFGNKCWYLSEFEGELVYTAPRSSAFNLNHHSLFGEWNVGVQVGPWWATYSLGARYYIDGNSDKIPAGVEMQNTAKAGLEF